MPMASRTMMSVSTMSSAPRLLANAAGANSTATRSSSLRASMVLAATLLISAGSMNFVIARALGSAAPEQRQRLVGGGLVSLGEIVEPGQRVLGVLLGRPGVEAGAEQVVKLIPADVA